MRLGRRTGMWNEASRASEEAALGAAAALMVEESTLDSAAAAAAAAEVCERGVVPAEPRIDGAIEFGMVCKPESSNVAGRPMAYASRREGREGCGSMEVTALSLRQCVSLAARGSIRSCDNCVVCGGSIRNCDNWTVCGTSSPAGRHDLLVEHGGCLVERKAGTACWCRR